MLMKWHKALISVKIYIHLEASYDVVFVVGKIVRYDFSVWLNFTSNRRIANSFVRRGNTRP